MKSETFLTKKSIKAGISIIMALALVLICFLSGNRVVMAASLPHIESIIESKTAYNILEIVPEGGTGSIGYYADKQEACADWRDELGTLATASERNEYVNSLFSSLISSDILGEGDTKPLKLLYSNGDDYYDEKYIWEPHNDYRELKLSSKDSAYVEGTMEKDPGKGEYTTYYNYHIVTSGGMYIQNIKYFEYLTDTYSPEQGREDGSYYYNPEFVELDPDDMASGNVPDTAIYVEDDGQYKYYSMGIDEDKTYYTWEKYAYVSDTGEPSEVPMRDSEVEGDDGETTETSISLSKMTPYRAVVDENEPFIKVSEGEEGYFDGSDDGFFYVGEGGDYVFTPGPGSQVKISFNTIFYKAGFSNNNWLLKYVFNLTDEEILTNTRKLSINVDTVKASDVTLAMVNSHDLIYISSGFLPSGEEPSGYMRGMDLSKGTAMAIFKKAVSDSPVIIEKSVINEIDYSNMLNIEKLSLLCLQDALPVTIDDDESFDSLNIVDSEFNLLNSDADGTFVIENVYCFDAFSPDTSSEDNVTHFANSKLSVPFSAETYMGGFSCVLEEILNENTFREIAGEEKLNEEVSMANAIRYIINYAEQRRTSKVTELRVLQIQPAGTTPKGGKDSSGGGYITKSDVLSWITTSDLTEDDIEITTMTTGEFIGRIEDINETYDLVYIGSSTERMNTKNGETVYNDEEMNGLIYSHIGDIYSSHIGMAGLLGRDYMTMVSGETAIDGTEDTEANKFRFSGNDITSASAFSIKQFVRAGYPVVVSDRLMDNKGKIDSGRTDSSSYMYTLLSEIAGSKNVTNESTARATSEKGLILKYLGVSKPEMIFLTDNVGKDIMPVIYKDDDGTGNPTSMKPDIDGNYYLKYSFYIENITDPTPQTTTYDCSLYIDVNSDGRYNSNEKLDDIEVRGPDGSRLFPDARGRYALLAGAGYTVTRQLPNELVGIIPWKLQVVKNGADHIHASKHNYTRIPGDSQKEKINILQVTSKGNTTGLINLEQQLNPGTGYEGYNGVYGKLIADLRDFDVSIKTIDTRALGKANSSYDATTDKIYTFIKDYDMLIIGFADMYSEIDADSAEAIVRYIDSGKSILFTHDTTSLTNVSDTNTKIVSVAEGENIPEPISVPWILTPTDTSLISILNSQQSDNIHSFDISVGSSPVESTTIEEIGAYSYSRERGGEWVKGSWTIGSETKSPYTIRYSTLLAKGNYYQKEWGYWEKNSSGDLDWKTGYVKDKNYREVERSGPVSKQVKMTTSTEEELPAGSYVVECDVTLPPGAKQTTVSVTGNDYINYYQYNYGGDNQTVLEGNTSSQDVTEHVQMFISTLGTTTPKISISTSTADAPVVLSVSGLTIYKYTQEESSLTMKFSDPSPWGYYFNTVIRDKVGLDRYGVTSKDQVGSSTLQQLLYGINDGDNLTGDQINSILNDEKDVAFKANTTQSAIVPETQGFTNYSLIRYGTKSESETLRNASTYNYTNNNYSKRETNYVSQVNEGQITTYPYNINTESFGGVKGSGNVMAIGKTHEQYYQLNMNTDDIVVWYCLSDENNGSLDQGSYYRDSPNDVVNAYYIFNKGNVTYSGVGHTSESKNYSGNVSEDFVNEAKLFVNTMIAAYQVGVQPPLVRIKDTPLGENDISVKYFTTEHSDENGTILENELSQSESEKTVYFKIIDTNMADTKEMSVEYYYSIDKGEKKPAEGIQTRIAETGTVPVSITGGVIYSATLDDEIMRSLSETGVQVVDFYVKVVTRIDGVERQGEDTIELRKVGLFNMR